MSTSKKAEKKTAKLSTKKRAKKTTASSEGVKPLTEPLSVDARFGMLSEAIKVVIESLRSAHQDIAALRPERVVVGTRTVLEGDEDSEEDVTLSDALEGIRLDLIDLGELLQEQRERMDGLECKLRDLQWDVRAGWDESGLYLDEVGIPTKKPLMMRIKQWLSAAE